MNPIETVQRKCIIALIAVISIFIPACQETDVSPGINPEATEITDYIQSLFYDADEMLNVQETGGSSSKRQLKSEQKNSTPGDGMATVCETKKFSLQNNFEEIAVLRPTNGIVFPGALVIGDKNMMGGLPTPVSLDRAPVTLRLDLPGIGAQGNIRVENPANSSVQTKIDEALNWWNENAYREGYVNAANSSYQASTSYSSKQMSLDVGLNVEWARGDVESQFRFTSTRTERVAMMVFKQVFYTISMDTPENPADIFGPGASLAQIKTTFGGEAPPAYIHSVAYGRIIMFRMITTAEAKDVELEGAFNYATGLNNASGTIEAKYKEILQKSSITTVTIGGNAEVATRAVTATGFGDLNPIITGENAVYSKNNPGVPIAYTVRFLKDNTFAKLGYTTEYEVQSCTPDIYPARDISVHNKTGKGIIAGWDIRYTITYKTKNSSGNVYNNTINSGTISRDKKVTKSVPAGAYNIRLTVEVKDGFSWKFLFDKTYDRPTRDCYETTGDIIGGKIYWKRVNC